MQGSVARSLVVKYQCDNADKAKAAMRHRTVKLAIKGMSCEKCAERIEEHVRDQSGVIRVIVDYVKNLGIVEFDADKIEPNDIIKDPVFNNVLEIATAKGKRVVHKYSAEIIETDSNGQEDS